MAHLSHRSPGMSGAVTTIVVILIVGAASVALLGGLELMDHPSAAQATSTSSRESTTSVGSTASMTTAAVVETTADSSSTTASASGSTSMTASNSSSDSSYIAVDSQYPNGTLVFGVYTELALNGADVATGYTPVAFQTISGQNYTVTVSDSKNLYFNRWSDNFSSRVMPAPATPSGSTLTAVFTTTPQPAPPTPYTITVDSSNINGTAIRGYLIDLRVGGYAIESGFSPVTFRNLEPGLHYQIVAYWAGNLYFRDFSNGDLNRYELVTFNSTGATSASYDAQYEYVLPSEAATLNVIAEFPNGTQIGTTFNNTGYIQHTPGLWLTVTPPGAATPYTGSDTGGSLLPFVLISGETYTVQMTLGFGAYHFSHWSDTGSTDATRAITLGPNATTIVAIYEQAQTPATTQAGPGSSAGAFALASFAIFVVSPGPSWSRRDPALRRSPRGTTR